MKIVNFSNVLYFGSEDRLIPVRFRLPDPDPEKKKSGQKTENPENLGAVNAG